MKLRAFFLTVLILFGALIQPLQIDAYTAPIDLDIKSEAIYLVNLDTGKAVFDKNADKRMVPASLTKIMTAILALEFEQDLDAVNIKAPNLVFDMLYGSGASNADIRHGEILSMRQLLYALMLQSAAEAALTIAYYVGDTDIEYFVDMMNKKAKEIGAVNTHFANPHGLHDPEQYTTAKDMYLITKYAMELDGFMEIASTARINLAPTNKHSADWWLTTTVQPQLRGSRYYYEPLRGIKTGTLNESGRCLVSTASKDGYTYLLVLMGAPLYDENGKMYPASTDNYASSETVAIYEWAFKTFRQKTLLEAGVLVGEIPVRLSFQQDYVKLASTEKFSDLIPSEVEANSVQLIPETPEVIDAPVKKGDVLGQVRIMLAGEEIGRVPLAASENIVRSDLLYYMDVARKVTRTFWFKFVLLFVVVLIVLYSIVMVVRNRSRSRYRNVRKKRL